MNINYLFSAYTILVLSFFSCEKNDEIDENANNQNSSKEDDPYLRGVEIFEKDYFINIKSNENFQPEKLYLSNSLENENINIDNIVSETEYSETGKIKKYKQQKSDLGDPILYDYIDGRVNITHLPGGVYYSCDLPFIGEGPTTIHDFDKDIAYIISSSGEDTLFYEIENGNVIKISTVEHVLYEYTYDDKPYFGNGIIYDFYSTEFDFQWWFVSEFIPKNNITSIKKYIYADTGTFSPDQDEVQENNFTYEYNKYGFPTELKEYGQTRMKFYYQFK